MVPSQLTDLRDYDSPYAGMAHMGGLEGCKPSKHPYFFPCGGGYASPTPSPAFHRGREGSAQPFLMNGKNVVTVAAEKNEIPKDRVLVVTYVYQEATSEVLEPWIRPDSPTWIIFAVSSSRWAR